MKKALGGWGWGARFQPPILRRIASIIIEPVIVHRQREGNPHDKNDGFAEEMGYKHGDERDGFEMEKVKTLHTISPSSARELWLKGQ